MFTTDVIKVVLCDICCLNSVKDCDGVLWWRVGLRHYATTAENG